MWDLFLFIVSLFISLPSIYRVDDSLGEILVMSSPFSPFEVELSR